MQFLFVIRPCRSEASGAPSSGEQNAATRGRAVQQAGITLPLQLLQMGFGVSLPTDGAAVAGGRLELGARARFARFAERGCRVTGRLVLELDGGAQAELHARAAGFAHPASSLQGAAAAASGAVAGVQLHVERGARLLPPALQAAAGGARLIGAQHVGDGPQPSFLGDPEGRGQKYPRTEKKPPLDPSHFPSRETPSSQANSTTPRGKQKRGNSVSAIPFAWRRFPECCSFFSRQKSAPGPLLSSAAFQRSLPPCEASSATKLLH